MKPEGLVQSIESRFQTLFKQLAREKTFTIYDELVAFALLQMRGWPKWNFPLSPCVPGLEMTQIAWLNAAKVRGHTLPTSLLRHTAHDHLISEITALKPGAVIAVGRKAASALDLMPSELLQRCKFVGFVKEQGASYVEVNAIATSLRALGLCR